MWVRRSLGMRRARTGWAVALAMAGIVSILGAGSSPATAGAAETPPPFRGEIQSFEPRAEPQALPEIAFQGPDGEKRSLADFRGRVIVLNFWAVWCAPCLKEMPSLDRLQAKLEKEPFEVVAISIDRGDGDGPRSFFQRLEINHLRLYRDPANQSSRAIKIRGLPTTLLIDGKGREIGRLEGGADWDSPEAEALIHYYLSALAASHQEG